MSSATDPLRRPRPQAEPRDEEERLQVPPTRTRRLVTEPVLSGSVAFSKNGGEDWAAVLLRDGCAVAVLADGAGGHPDAGPCAVLAGTTALAALAGAGVSEIAVFAAVAAAHSALRTAAVAGLLHPDAATTLLIAAMVEGRVIGAKHGDSTFAITTDTGTGTGTEMPQPHVPEPAAGNTPFLTTDPRLEPHVFSCALHTGQIVILASDGASPGLVTAPPPSPHETSAKAVLAAARNAGSRDDATIALIGLAPGNMP